MCQFSNFLDFENGYRYLNTFARKGRKTHGFLACLFKYRHHFIDLKASLAYIRSIIGEKLG